MRKRYIKEELQGKLSFPSYCPSEEIKSELKRYISNTRKENSLNVFVTGVTLVNEEIVFSLGAEHISKGLLCKHFSPTYFSVITTLDLTFSISAFILEKKKQISKFFGQDYSLRIVGQTMRENDSKILVCVLAEKSL